MEAEVILKSGKDKERRATMRMTADEFAAAVSEAIASIPEDLREYLEGVAIDVADEPTADELRDLGVRRREDLLGAYFGTPLTERSVEDARLGDRIVVYQRNLERMCRTRESLVRQIALTVLHEVGHHFGLDEDDLEARGFG